MSGDYQRTLIVGNVGRDPEMRYTPQGQAVTSFSVAVNTQYGDNKWTTWYRVTTWGKQAEICNQYVKKGMKVLVEGELTPDKATGGPKIWGDPPKASFELNASNVRFLTYVEGGEHQQDAGGVPADALPF